MNISKYDENLVQNDFYKYLTLNYNDLIEQLSKNNWILCIPRTGAIDCVNLSKSDYLDHILIKKQSDPNSFTTLNQNQVSKDNTQLQIVLEKTKILANILFIEVFYVNKCKYFVWCVDRPLNSISYDNVADINFLHDSVDSLLIDKIDEKLIKKIRNSIEVFLSENSFQTSHFQEMKSSVRELYEKCLQQCDNNNETKMHFSCTLQVAVKSYIQICLGEQLFDWISSYAAQLDSNFNKIIQSLQELPLEAYEIDIPFQDLNLTKYELNGINRTNVILNKMKCLKRVLNILTSIKAEGCTISADGLLHIFTYLIIKSNVQNWMSNLVYLKEFQFDSKLPTDENDFLLTTLQAAIEYIETGSLISKISNLDVDHSNNVQGYLSMLFTYIHEGKIQQIDDFFARKVTITDDLSLCHPLCCCKHCKQSLDGLTVDVDCVDEFGCSALHVASKLGREDIVNNLLQKCANINILDGSMKTPLHYAALRGHQNVLLVLLNSECDVFIKDFEGNTALHLATRNCHQHCVNALIYLIKSELVPSFINSTNNCGESALHIACRYGYNDLVNVLLQHGAALLKNRTKLSPFDLALNNVTRDVLVRSGVTEIDYEMEKVSEYFVIYSIINNRLE